MNYYTNYSENNIIQQTSNSLPQPGLRWFWTVGCAGLSGASSKPGVYKFSKNLEATSKF